MSDIVERLRVRRNPMLDGEREEAAAEIERLRGLLREALLGPSQFPDWFISRAREALGEFEHLFARARDMSQIAQSAWPEHCEIERPIQDRGLYPEIDRLRGENLARGNALGRIAVALFGDQNNRTDEECVAAAAEVGYGLAGCREKVAWQAEEIERLRGLLRESLRIDAGDFSVNVDEWIKRVREALGE